MKRLRPIIPITLGLCLMTQTSWASRAYITDSFRISLRRGPSIENKILKFLPSGQPVEVFKSDEGWSHIQPVEDNEENISGWVLSRYLITRQPWENQARSLAEKNTQLQKKLSQLEKKWKEADGRGAQITKEFKENSAALRDLESKYTTLRRDAAHFLELKEAYETAQKTIRKMAQENEELRSSQMNRWFGMGALVLLCGLILGLMVGRQQKRQRSHY